MSIEIHYAIAIVLIIYSLDLSGQLIGHYPLP